MSSAHEGLPQDEARDNLIKFFRVVGPEIRPVAHNQLSESLRRGVLTDQLAVAILPDLWADEMMRAARLAWQRADGEHHLPD